MADDMMVRHVIDSAMLEKLAGKKVPDKPFCRIEVKGNWSDRVGLDVATDRCDQPVPHGLHTTSMPRWWGSQDDISYTEMVTTPWCT